MLTAKLVLVAVLTTLESFVSISRFVQCQGEVHIEGADSGPRRTYDKGITFLSPRWERNLVDGWVDSDFAAN